MVIELGGTALGLILTTLSMTTSNESGPRGIDSKEAYNMVTMSPSSTFVLDVRTAEEYTFVGHPDLPDGVPNIPLKFFPTWEPNSNFASEVAKRYKKEDKIITMCRSGGRAEIAAEVLTAAGFKNVLYMTDSFEGQEDAEGLRTVNGWKNNNLPYTYKVEDELRYR